MNPESSPGHKVRLSTGERLFSQGDEANYLYLLESGSVDVFVHHNGELSKFGHRTDGAFLGEMAMVPGGRRATTVIAKTPCVVLAISREHFRLKVGELGPLMRHCLLTMLDRLDASLSEATPGSERERQLDKPELLESGKDAIDSVQFEMEFQRALSEQQFELHLQPIVSLADETVSSYEALVRWNHPQWGLIPPDRFIPYAESVGLIHPITDWVTGTAANFIRQVREQIGSATEISVNVSACDLAHGGLVDVFDKHMSEHGLHSHELSIEVTENGLMSDPLSAARELRACQQNGLSVAIDDFGTGYASFAYLRDYPAQRLKIDRSFVSGMTTDRRSRQVVDSMVAVSQKFEMEVIAEGVETEAQLKLLRDFGCGKAQGYYFARPMPLAEAFEWHKANLKKRGKTPRTSSRTRKPAVLSSNID